MLKLTNKELKSVVGGSASVANYEEALATIKTGMENEHSVIVKFESYSTSARKYYQATFTFHKKLWDDIVRSGDAFKDAVKASFEWNGTAYSPAGMTLGDRVSQIESVAYRYFQT